MTVHILHLETSTKVCSVGLSRDGKLIALKEIAEENYSHAENITLFIEDVLKQAEITIKDIHAVSVSSGPGSYTGLRIGVSTAKGLCYPLNIPLIAIDSLTALAEIARDKHKTSNLCPLIDARRMEVFNAIYNKEGEQIKPISADIIDEEIYSSYAPFTYFGDGAAKLQEILEDKNCTIYSTILSSAKGQVSIAHKKFLNNDFEDVAYFEPFYLKDFVAGKKVK